MENKFSGKYFQLTVCFNGFDPEIGFSQNFHFKPFPDSRAKRERESLDHAFDFAGKPRAQITLLTSPIYKSIYEPTNRSSTQSLWPTDLRTHEPIYEPTNRSSTQSLRPTSLQIRRRPRAFAPQTHELISLSLSVILIFCVILIDPRTNLCFCVILIFYFLSLISNFFVVVVVVWVVVFWWFSYCVVVGFVWVVVENNIFKMLPDTWKYFLEQFS